MRMSGRRAAIALACCVVLLTGCGVDPSALFRDRSVQRITTAPWVRSADRVVEVDPIGRSYVALEINVQHRFQLVALSRSTGRTTHRVGIDPFRGWDPDAGLDLTLVNGAIAYHRAGDPKQDRFDFLDPATFKTRWSRRGAVKAVNDCRPMVCLVDTRGVSHVIDPKTGRERWRVKAVDLAWYGFLVKLSWDDDAHLMVSRVDPLTGKARWTADAMAPLPLPTNWVSTQVAWGPVPGGRIGVDTWLARKKGGPKRLAGATVFAADGTLSWSTHAQLDIATDRLVDVRSDHDVGVLDARTGHVRMRLRAPAGYEITDIPLAFDVLGRRWATFERTHAKRTVLTFRLLDERHRKLATTTPGLHLPVLSYDYDEPDVKVTVQGEQRSLPAHFGPRPLDDADGELVSMPRVPLPEVLRDPWTPLGSVIDKDGHAIMEPVP